MPVGEWEPWYAMAGRRADDHRAAESLLGRQTKNDERVNGKTRATCNRTQSRRRSKKHEPRNNKHASDGNKAARAQGEARRRETNPPLASGEDAMEEKKEDPGGRIDGGETKELQP